jgi:hypothetical protein
MTTELDNALAYAKKLFDALTPEQKKAIKKKNADPNWHIRAAWGDMADAIIANRNKKK